MSSKKNISAIQDLVLMIPATSTLVLSEIASQNIIYLFILAFLQRTA